MDNPIIIIKRETFNKDSRRNYQVFNFNSYKFMNKYQKLYVALFY